MLSFISFWRAAAIVLSDLASSAYYVGGIAEQAIGKAAPWFILAIMLFSYAVRAIYIESCSMFVRGGVYKVVHEAMGGTLAKFSVSALMFDYVLTGPISGVSAGLYLGGLINETGRVPAYSQSARSSALFRGGVRGRGHHLFLAQEHHRHSRIQREGAAHHADHHRDGGDPDRLVPGHDLQDGYQPVPLPTLANLHFSRKALGWLKGTVAPSITVIAIMVGLGHSLLAMSGEESLAQVNREIAHPKLKNLERAGFVIFIYSMLFTSLVSFFAVMIIPDAARQKFLDNLIGGLSMFLVGPMSVRLLFHGFVVLVGTLILAGAVNTAIIGSNGVLNRVAEDGVLPDWFRHPHHKFGTTSRLINLIVILQLITILISRGDVYMLGEAYAFGVVWSFAMKALSVLVLRYKQPGGREWKVPLNFHIGGTEIPVGLMMITVALFALAIINVLTKESGHDLGRELYDRVLHRVRDLGKIQSLHTAAHSQEMEKFRLNTDEDLSAEAAHVRPGNVLVAVRNPNRLQHLQRVLEKTDTRRMDIVVLSVRQVTQAASGEHALDASQIFSEDETEVFTKVVTLAEKAGKHVELMVVPGSDPYEAMVQTAARLQSSRIVMGLSPKMTPSEQGAAVGREWEKLPEPRPSLSWKSWRRARKNPSSSIWARIRPGCGRRISDLLHQLWLELARKARARSCTIATSSAWRCGACRKRLSPVRRMMS